MNYSILLGWYAMMSTFASFAGQVDQGQRLIRGDAKDEKSEETDVSPSMIITTLNTTAAWFVFGLVSGENFVMVTNAVGLCSASFLTICWLRKCGAEHRVKN